VGESKQLCLGVQLRYCCFGVDVFAVGVGNGQEHWYKAGLDLNGSLNCYVAVGQYD
jgi:hypothetical protein